MLPSSLVRELLCLRCKATWILGPVPAYAEERRKEAADVSSGEPVGNGDANSRDNGPTFVIEAHLQCESS